MGLTDEKLHNYVNSSGFPLQIGLEHQINNSGGSHSWNVLYSEHSWKNRDTDNSGFIDLVLTDRHGTSVMVVECKRVQNTSWIFLLPDERQSSRRHARAWVSRFNSGQISHFDWTDVTADYPSPQSAFCVVPGQDSKSRPMLERVAAELVEATEALAKEEYHLFKGKPDYIRIYLNVIVTTAQLKLCAFSPESVSIDSGLISSAQFKTVPYLRFRKSLSTKSVEDLNLSELTHYNLTQAKENTVFVVNSSHIIDFLNKFEIDDSIFNRFK